MSLVKKFFAGTDNEWTATFVCFTWWCGRVVDNAKCLSSGLRNYENIEHYATYNLCNSFYINELELHADLTIMDVNKTDKR